GAEVPTATAEQELEEDKFDKTFKILYISKTITEEIQQKLMKVSEVASIEVVPFVLDAYKKQAKTKNTTAVTEKNAAPEKKQKAKQSNDNAPKQTKNPPTKTIRINIER